MIVYLPDSVLYPLQELAELDPEMTAVCCTRDDEGVALASGAALAGRHVALLVEGTGVGMAALALAGLIARRTPLLVVSSHSEALGMRASYDDLACLVNEPVLRALAIPTAVLRHLDEAALIVAESLKSATLRRGPAAVVVPPYIMTEG
jgi:sulfopyruvate decarboxylase TPP-binding subunit